MENLTVILSLAALAISIISLVACVLNKIPTDDLVDKFKFLLSRYTRENNEKLGNLYDLIREIDSDVISMKHNPQIIKGNEQLKRENNKHAIKMLKRQIKDLEGK